MWRAILLVLVLNAHANAQVVTTLAKGESGKIVFRSSAPGGQTEMLRMRQGFPSAEVSGHLALPDKAAGKVPAMVLLTSSGGVRDANLGLWRDKFLALGIASFIIDSFSARGIGFGGPNHRHAQMVDAYEALKLLATHPGIDAERVAVLGFSLGGISAMEASIEEFREMFGVGGLRFAAHIALYPSPCNFRFVEAKARPEPVVAFLPENEDWTPVALCQAYIEVLKRGGADARGVLLPGAYHGFDLLDLNRHRASYPTAGSCNIETSVKTGAMRRPDTSEFIASREAFQRYISSCQGNTASLVGDGKVLAQVEAEIRNVLSAVFKMPLK